MEIDLNHMGRLMHESWTATKRAQGFHGLGDTCAKCFDAAPDEYPFGAGTALRCSKFHPDLIDWSLLPAEQQDINLHAFDSVLPYLQEQMDEALKTATELTVWLEDVAEVAANVHFSWHLPKLIEALSRKPKS